MELLGTGYPYEIHILDNTSKEVQKIFVPENVGQTIQKELRDKDTRFITIGGNSYFWSDIRYCGVIEVPKWLDYLLFKSGNIQNPKNRILILKELTRLRKDNRGFNSEDEVFIYLTLNGECKQ